MRPSDDGSANPWGFTENQIPRTSISIRTGVSLSRGRPPVEAVPRAPGPPIPAPHERPGRLRQAEEERNPSWTGIWFKVECSLERRVAHRTGYPGNGGHPDRG
ncbi:hypothetical protein GCM10009602_51010 [Nocardiopsis tropica]